ncbi:formylglycine-generating enzyme family protein [Acinetobacter guerrae]|uniref:formylglycine-generating enzyme family protein n=1 Tax=Acinetobacter guerrae TaxID=1843371 RepID=UPI00125F00E9|nr:formylglycine-generating enzyme family protein [Acinetobacter guerrae]
MKRILLFSSLILFCGCQKAIPEKTSPFQLGDTAKCATYSGLPKGWPLQKEAGMVKLSNGEILLGTTLGYADERPFGEKPSQIKSFWIDATEVTNAQFAEFVKQTGYITDAEKQGGGAMFIQPSHPVAELQWWTFERGANWKTPWGLHSHKRPKPNEPVRMVTWNDAFAYANWLGHDLPTELEWEYAAKGFQAKSDIGPSHNGHITANYWQGEFPYQNNQEDGFNEVAPVGCFDANPFGLYDMIGNVWEWTQTPYKGMRDHHMGDPAQSRHQHEDVVKYTIKGGSYLCASNYCARYRAAARHPQELDLATSHVGFRTVKRF